MIIFIDTNVFLSFYQFTNDDLEQLKKLAVLLEDNKVSLCLPEQVIREFNRNRENKIAEAMKLLRDQKFSFQFPQFCKDYEEYVQLKDLMKESSKLHSKLLERAQEDIWSQKLKADETIQSLFNFAERVECGDEIMELARLRMDIRNPPGKNGSLGDAINWEALLTHVPEKEDIYFIADDKDYYSPLDSSVFNTFLQHEWTSRK
jgi:hypothetical protein